MCSYQHTSTDSARRGLTTALALALAACAPTGTDERPAAGRAEERCGPERDAPAAPAHPRARRARADLDGPAPVHAAADTGHPWRAVPFLERHLYSYGLAVLRRGGDPCEGASLLVANGHDHTPQYAARLPTGTRCLPSPGPARAVSERALHYADVATGDLDGDGDDEAILAALAGATQRPDAGGLILAELRDGEWRERWIDDGLAVSSVALGDLDGDGDLDLVVGTFWAPAQEQDATPRRDNPCASPDEGLERMPETVGRLLPSGLRGPIFVYLQGDDGELRRALRIPSMSAAQLRLADVDLDGDLDLLAGGREVHLLEGPLVADGPLTCERLWAPKSAAPYALGVDVAVSAAHDGPPLALIAASEGCSDSAGCGRLDRSGFHLWTRAIGASPSLARRHSFHRTDGIAAPVRFTDLDADATLDVAVGRMTAASCDPEARLYRTCVGAPVVGFTGAWERAEYGLRGDAELPLDARSRGPHTRPMSARILPYAGEAARSGAADEPRCYGGASSRECRCGACPPATAPLVTYTGAGLVVGAAEVEDAAGPLPFRHVYGDRHIALARAPVGALRVTWRVVSRPGLLVASASPIDLGGSSLYLEAPAEPDLQ